MSSMGVLGDVSNSLRRHGVQPKMLFDRLDSNRSGCLSRDDLYRMALMYRPNIAPVEFDELFWHMNRSCSGEISFSEFCGALGFSAEVSGLDPFLQDIVRRIHNSLMDMNVTPEQLFARLDATAANTLGPAEIAHMVRCFNQQLNQLELDNLYRHFSAGTNAVVDLRMFCRALGFSDGIVIGSVAASRGASWERIAQLTRSVQAKGTVLQDSFRLFDTNNDGYLDRDELHRLLMTCDPSINQFESDDVFNRVAPQGLLRFQEFAQALQIPVPSTASQNTPGGYWLKCPTKLDPALRSMADRISSWLEPALLSQCLGLTAQSRISRAGFDQMVQAMEPQLGPRELDRLFQQTGATMSGELEVGDFTRRFGSDDGAGAMYMNGPGSDPWAFALLRRVARRIAAALSAPQDLFKRYSITVSGTLSQQEFANLMRGQFPTITPAEVDALWNLADANRDGRVDLYEFSTALRMLTLESRESMSSISAPDARLGSRMDRVIEARIAQLARCLCERGLSLAQAFRPFDIQGSGFIDRIGFHKLLANIGMKLADWEVGEITSWFDTAKDGRINYQEIVRWFDVSAQARSAADAYARAVEVRDRSVQDTASTGQGAWNRVAQAVQRWQMQGSTLHDAFILFDSNKDGNLDSLEFFRLMVTCDPSINQYESNDIFTRIAGPAGQLDINKFATAFSLSSDALAASKPSMPTGSLIPRLDPPMHSLVSRVNGWLEPALLSRSLGVTNQSRLSRPDFDRMVLSIEPRLSSQDLDRLFLQANAAGTGFVDVNDLVRRFTSGGASLAPGPGADQWALALMRRVANRVNLALAAPEDLFRKFNINGEGLLSQIEFERMVRMQDNTLTMADVDKLWRFADRDGNGRVDLQEFCNCLRQAQMEAEDTTGWSTSPPATLGSRDRVVEVRMAQLARCCAERGLSLTRAFALYDQQSTGFIDRNSLQQLMMGVGLNIADWEVAEIVVWGDTARDGRLNYRELLRQFHFLMKAKLAGDTPATQRSIGNAFNAEVEARVAQLAKHLREREINLAELFRFYDADKNNFLERHECRTLLQAIDPSLTDLLCEKIFEVAAVGGRLDLAAFVRRFSVLADLSTSMGSLERPSYASPASQVLAETLQSVAGQIQRWLEPLMLNRTLGMAGRQRISRADFDRMVQVVEPNLGALELDRLYRQADVIGNGSRELDAFDFLRRFDREASLLPLGDSTPGVGVSTDRWAIAALRRIARRVGPMISSTEHTFRRMDIGGTGPLTVADLHRFLQSQEAALNRQHVEALFQQADSGRKGVLMLQEFCDALGSLQLEAERSRPAASSVPAGSPIRDRVIEVRGVTLARLLHDRGFSLEKAFALFDLQKTGFLDRPAFHQLLRAAASSIAGWEEDEFFLQCDTAQRGLLDCRELLRRLRAVKVPGSPVQPAGSMPAMPSSSSATALGSTSPSLATASALQGTAPYAAATAQLAQPPLASTWPAAGTSSSLQSAAAAPFWQDVAGRSLSSTASLASPLGMSLGPAAPATMPYTPGPSTSASTPSFTPAPAAPLLPAASYGTPPPPPVGFAASPYTAPSPLAPAAPLGQAPFSSTPLGMSALQSTLSMNPLLNQVVARLRVNVQVPADQLFRQYDMLCNGTLNENEFERFVRTYDPTVGIQDVKTLWSCLDSNGDGRIDLIEFSSLLQM